MYKFFVLAALAFSSFSFAVSQSSNGQVVTERNEEICKQAFGKKMFNQQIIFSSKKNDAQVRRIAERKITASRDKFQQTGSYCDAIDVLDTFEPSSLERKPGDAQFQQ